ncbi:hypothetical protein [Pseudodesulfovibrio sediminis]|uniref:Uncharacterized protein n=1 Tax=Pseudodesulfovibrio sediminis TaxID=2810563 RepID=A0ABM9SDU9_9BACT|nr:hypothetical protein [Pseudodesulfovibrio sediminis]BCS89988.1 hypothetical protein PSDVSF_32300 [Pseudodesulfovibrio sediminis]
MGTIEIEHATMESIQMLMRLIQRLDEYYPGVALVKSQAEAVEDMIKDCTQAQTS